jgi:wyosine [tRNA(Phe)-imidazoG37] synthetase (radical SAM superfamily)
MASVMDHARTFADLAFVYPVISRRSGGLSLGVNLNPDKRCNFDCVYCEVDRRSPGRMRPVDVALIRAELSALIRAAKSGQLGEEPKFREVAALTRVIKDIAFSGDGEPTMVPHFAACVEAVVGVKVAERLDDTKIVLITDAAGLDKADVRKGLALMDRHQGEVWGKLDAGTEAYYRLVNRSHVAFDRIRRNLLLTARVRPIVIQSLFLKVRGEGMSAAELDAYCGRLRELVSGDGQVKEVHAYTIARPTPEPWATRLDGAELEAIASVIRDRTGLRVLTYA